MLPACRSAQVRRDSRAQARHCCLVIDAPFPADMIWPGRAACSSLLAGDGWVTAQDADTDGDGDSDPSCHGSDEMMRAAS
jgi:hypothetical protein